MPATGPDAQAPHAVALITLASAGDISGMHRLIHTYTDEASEADHAMCALVQWSTFFAAQLATIVATDQDTPLESVLDRCARAALRAIGDLPLLED